jgi:hypothetical protein
MPSLKYALEKGEPRRLVISWKSVWKIKDVTICLDGTEIGSIADKNDLEAGQPFPLEGGTLKIRFDGKKLLAFKDGQLLVADPTPQLRLAYGIIFFIAGIDIIIGMAAELLQVELLKELGIDYTYIIIGVIFLALGFFVRRMSRIALRIAVGLYALDAILTFIIGISMGKFLITGLIWHIFFLIIMSKGFSAIRDLKQGW